MPSGEYKPLLDRAFAREAARPITDLTSPLLKELVDAGAWAFRRCEVAAADDPIGDHHLPALILCRQVLEMADGIQVLLAESCGTAAIPALRSLFEAHLGLSYLVADRDGYQRRARAWLVAGLHEDIKTRDLLSPDKAASDAYQQLYVKEFGQPPATAPSLAIAEETLEIRKTLASPGFVEADAEYENMRQQLKRIPQWYGLHGGPANLAELAETTNNGSMYRLLYGNWSRLGHARDLTRFFGAKDGKAAWEPIRRANELRSVALFSALLVIQTIRLMIQHFRQGEDLSRWYERDVQPLFRKLEALKVQIIPVTADSS